MVLKNTIFALLLLVFTSVFGQEGKEKPLQLQMLPSIFHTPETSWGMGAILLGYHTPKDSLTRKSNVQLFLDATLMKQMSFQSDFNIYTAKNKYFIRGSHDLSKFPEFYFGIGNNNEWSDHCLINIAYFDVKTDVYKSFKKQRYLGVKIHHQNLAQIDKPIEQAGLSIDDMGYISTGLGLGFLVDKRNNMLNPTEGHYLETKAMKYFDHTHMTGGFNNFMVDARYYKTIKKTAINSNLYVVKNTGTVPFRLMPGIGGARFLRGYYAGRFRDKNMALFQAEVRRPIFWRIGIAAFSGIGQVYANSNEFGINRFHYNYGGGLRFQIHKNSSANIRIDYGRTKDSDGFYIVYGECF
jgi:outer membrane protein assembly factor BamA